MIRLIKTIATQSIAWSTNSHASHPPISCNPSAAMAIASARKMRGRVSCGGRNNELSFSGKFIPAI